MGLDAPHANGGAVVNEAQQASDAGSTDVLGMGGSHQLTLNAAQVEVVRGPDCGKRIRLEKAKTRVGTSAGNDLHLCDPTVSRVHCEIVLTGTGIRIVDLGSSNGTVIGDARVHDAELRGGTLVTLGATVLRVDLSAEEVVIPLSERMRFGELLGMSPEMRRLYAVLERAAPSDATVLVLGETGTGKEVVARSLHAASRRAEGPFVALDCGAIAETLIESELFGHTKGAFTGAANERRGLLEEADGGTLFLDEIGELPASLQPKLLRALEGREIRRVGSNTSRPVDVRVIAATNRPLAHAVNEGTFREDLYYRLAVIELELPPLRARREDIPILAQHFHARATGRDVPLPHDLLESLLSRAWPGNVRELRNHIERAVTLGWSPDVQRTQAPRAPTAPDAMVLGVTSDMPLHEAREACIASFEKAYVAALLQRTAGNVTRAASLAGVTRRTLHRVMAQHGVRTK